MSQRRRLGPSTTASTTNNNTQLVVAANNVPAASSSSITSYVHERLDLAEASARQLQAKAVNAARDHAARDGRRRAVGDG